MWRTDVDVPVDDFPGRAARDFDAVDGCCCLWHGGCKVSVWICSLVSEGFVIVV